MSRWPPLTCKEVKAALGKLGFSPQPGRGTSHEQWVRDDQRGYFKVTVDCPKAPFSLTLIDIMARQAGTDRAGLYRAADKKKKWQWLW